MGALVRKPAGTDPRQRLYARSGTTRFLNGNELGRVDILSLRYRDQDWEQDSYALAAECADPGPCPLCSRTGFFGPRARDGGVKFRACRFCGFTQMVGEPPTLHRPVIHGCDAWPQCARAPYIWWVDPDCQRFTCMFCDEEVDVFECSNGRVVVPPSNDAAHPWWRVPQHKSFEYYQKFWSNWPTTKGRVVL